jgi:hypothetical protein
MTEPFSQQDFTEAGAKCLTIFEALEDQDLQKHLLDARTSIEAAVRNLRAQGFDSRDVALTLVGIVLGPIFNDR